MDEQSDLNETWERWTQLQRELWDIGAKTFDVYRPAGVSKQAPSNPLEIGADFLKSYFRIQADCLGAALGSRYSGSPLPKLAVQQFESMQAMMEGWLEFQGKIYGSWMEAMSQFDPIRCGSPDRLFDAAKDWMRTCARLAEQSVESQARFMSAAAPSGAESPASSRPQPRKERRRVSETAAA